ncbi:MAG TPA: hypothetical protein VMF52_02150 [Steroidobacteraceae bacterium]|nr:hypothetical protein [Steroidobacteraceae bacterium]
MRRFFLPIFLAAMSGLTAQAAHADGAQRFNTDGKVQIRFFFDDTFVGNGFTQFRNMERDLLASLQNIGKHNLGINFQANTDGVSTIHLPPPARTPHYTRQEIVDVFARIVPPRAGYVNVLIHAYGVTANGICGLDDPNNNFNQQDEGDTVPASPVNGVASGTVTVTAKADCSTAGTALKSMGALTDSFVHEMGHILLLPDEFPPNKNCTTKPTAGVMCQQVGPGVKRSYLKWFLSDIQTTRTAYFGANKKNPTLACYEWSSFQACDTNCVNGAGFPSPGAGEVYNACVVAHCNHICPN